MPAAAIIGSAVIGSVGSNRAARTAARGADAATAEQRRQYDQTREDQAPFREAGVNALARLQDPAAFTASPSYAFRRTEGNRGIEQSAAARGGALSGNALRALTDFNSNLASDEYGNWWNQQAGLAGVGQQATNVLAQVGQNTANNISANMQNAANARASGIIGIGNSLNDALGAWGFFNNWYSS